MNTVKRTLGPLQQDERFGLAFRTMEPAPAAPTSLVVLLHGVGSNETSVSDLCSALGSDTLVILPRGPLTLGPNQAAWFRVAFTSSGPQIVEEEAHRARVTLIRFIRQLQAFYQISPQKTVVAGFSQGGIMSAGIALSEPELLTGFGLLSGRILPEWAPHFAITERLKTIQAFVGHGELDNTLPVSWADQADLLLNKLKVTSESHRYPIGHTISPAMHSDFSTWMQRVLYQR